MIISIFVDEKQDFSIKNIHFIKEEYQTKTIYPKMIFFI